MHRTFKTDSQRLIKFTFYQENNDKLKSTSNENKDNITNL